MTAALVWVDGWQLDCCGEPFAVGDTVAWRLRDDPDVAWLSTVLEPAVARRVAHAQEHHDEMPAPVRRARVVAIEAASCAYAATGDDGRTLRPVAGSSVLRPVDRADRADGSAEEQAGTRLTGYLVHVDLF